MLILVLIDIQYMQNVVFSFEKGSNGQNHSSSDSHHPTTHTPTKSAYFYMDVNCFGLVRVISSWLRVNSVVADSFGWVFLDGFAWLRMVSGGFGWFRVVYCFSSYEILRLMKNAFYFILKALFVLKIFKFLS